MIDQVINAILFQLNTYMDTVEPEVVLGNISLIDAYQDSSSQSLSDKVVASIVNIEQEGTLRNIPFRSTAFLTNGPQGIERQPEIYLNVYVLFGANKNNYSTALQRISQVISFFQRKYVFVPNDTPLLASFNLEKLVFELYSTRFEELNQLWGVMGGKYIPSVVYKMKLAVIQDAEEQGTGIISEVRLRSGNLSSPAVR